MNLSEQLDPENRNISKNKEEKKNPKPTPPPKKNTEEKNAYKKNTKTPKEPIWKKIEKKKIYLLQGKVQYYNECSKTNATRNKQIPKSRSLKYKHMY